jgi:NAD-dependent SIR2 family protein deacetylase
MLICGTSAVVYPFANLPRVARERKVERQRQSDSGLFVVEKSAAVTIIEINAESTPLTYEKISDYLIQGKTGEVLPEVVQEVKRLIKR